MNTDNKTLVDVYKKLPQKIREVIVSPEFHERCVSILQNKVPEEKIEELEKLITYQIIGLLTKEETENKIKNETQISAENVIQIINDINIKIIDSLDEIYLLSLNNIKDGIKDLGIDFNVDSYVKESANEIEKSHDKKYQANKQQKSSQGLKEFNRKSPIQLLGELVSNKELMQINNKVEKQDLARKSKSSLRIGDKDNVPDFIKSLTLPVQEIIFDDAWLKRTEEIAKKYSLDQAQTDTLSTNVFLILCGIDKTDDFLKLMTSELGISRLLADQIIDDLEMRVFEYALKTIENKQRKNVTQPTIKQSPPPEKIVQKPNLPTIEISKVPEIKPVTFPMVEEGEVAHDVAIPRVKIPAEYKPVFNGPTTPIAEIPKVSSQINYEKASFTKEQVQRPISVPRFTGIKTEKDTSGIISEHKIPTVKPIESPINRVSLIDQKLNSFEPAEQAGPTSTSKTNPENKPAPKYTNDPYREPLE